MLGPLVAMSMFAIGLGVVVLFKYVAFVYGGV